MAGRLISFALAGTINQNSITNAASAAPDHSMVRLIPNHDHHTNRAQFSSAAWYLVGIIYLMRFTSVRVIRSRYGSDAIAG